MGRIIALRAFVKKIMLNTISLTLYFLHHSLGADIAHLTIVEVKLKINICKKLYRLVVILDQLSLLHENRENFRVRMAVL